MQNYITQQVDENGYLNTWSDAVKRKLLGIHFWGIITSPIAIHESKERDYDEDYCNRNGIPILHNNRAGGTIVTFAGDVAFYYYEEENHVPYEIQNLIHYLHREKHMDVRLSDTDKFIGRDVLVDGVYKVATFTNTPLADGSGYFCAGHITVNCDLELVKRICKKEMHHIPKGLSDYGITTGQIASIINGEMEL